MSLASRSKKFFVRSNCFCHMAVAHMLRISRNPRELYVTWITAAISGAAVPHVASLMAGYDASLFGFHRYTRAHAPPISIARSASLSRSVSMNGLTPCS